MIFDYNLTKTDKLLTVIERVHLKIPVFSFCLKLREESGKYAFVVHC